MHRSRGVGPLQLGRGLGSGVAGVLKAGVFGQVAGQRAIVDRRALVDAERRHHGAGLTARMLAANHRQVKRQIGDARVEVYPAVVLAAGVALRIIQIPSARLQVAARTPPAVWASTAAAMCTTRGAEMYARVQRRPGGVERVAPELRLVEGVRHPGELVGVGGRRVARAPVLIDQPLPGPRLLAPLL